MGTWTKVFKDGSTEVGTDAQITNQKASWSRGRLDNIKSVEIYEKNFGISCTIDNTSWHQFDRFISFFNQTGPQCNRVFRAIQAQIKQKHIGKYIIINRIQFVYFITINDTGPGFMIANKHIDKWLTFAISHSGKFNMSISEKGKFK